MKAEVCALDPKIQRGIYLAKGVSAHLFNTLEGWKRIQKAFSQRNLELIIDEESRRKFLWTLARHRYRQQHELDAQLSEKEVGEFYCLVADALQLENCFSDGVIPFVERPQNCSPFFWKSLLDRDMPDNCFSPFYWTFIKWLVLSDTPATRIQLGNYIPSILLKIWLNDDPCLKELFGFLLNVSLQGSEIEKKSAKNEKEETMLELEARLKPWRLLSKVAGFWEGDGGVTAFQDHLRSVVRSR